MALVAIRAAIYVATNATVVGVGLGLGMAIRARKDRIVRGIRMASGANSTGITMIGWEPCVVERRSGPSCGGVTGLAGGRETGRGVIRIGGGLVVGLVTGEAIGRNRSVVVVHMATGAGHRGVFAGQGEWRVVVIERRRNPGRGVVAHIALLWKPGLNMIRVGGSVEVAQVTGGAGGIVQAVISVDMALRTLQRDMRPGQRKPGGGVIKGCIQPGHRRVA